MKSTYTYDRFYNYEEMTNILKDYEKSYPELFKLTSLATTKEGREIWLVEFTDLNTGNFCEKPGYFLNGHIHAGEVTGTMCVMHFIDYMLTNIDDPSVKSLLANTTFYIIPRLSPDGAEYYLTNPGMLRSVNEMFPFSELQPGVQPADLDGDGVIRKMLVPSPYGSWKKDKDDPRVIQRRRPNDIEGTFYNICVEGLIEDYDGFTIANAPPKFGIDLNRNFPLNWDTNNKQPGAGFHALDRIESRTLANFIVTHRNIVSTINFHTYSGVYLYPPASKSKKDANPFDMKLYERINKIVTETTGYKSVSIKDEFIGADKPKLSGSLDEFLYNGNGIFSYSIEAWDIWTRSGSELPFPDPFSKSDEQLEEFSRKIYKWADDNDIGSYIKEWTPFEHPQLGSVEIGGEDPKFFTQNPPPKFLTEEVERHTKFILQHALTMPKLVIRKVDIEPLGAGIYKVEAYVYNAGFMPTYGTKEYLNLNLAKEIEVELTGDSLSYESGKQLQKIGQLEGFSRASTSYSFFGIMSAAGEYPEKKVTWVVKAKSGELKVTARSERAGMATATVRID